MARDQSNEPGCEGAFDGDIGGRGAAHPGRPGCDAVVARQTHLSFATEHRRKSRGAAASRPLPISRTLFAQVLGAPGDLPAADANRTKPGEETVSASLEFARISAAFRRDRRRAIRGGLMAAGSASVTARSTTQAGRIRQGPAPRNLEYSALRVHSGYEKCQLAKAPRRLQNGVALHPTL